MVKKILVIDDSPTELQVMSDAVKNAGYTVITGIDGDDCLEKVKSEKPDLVILDVILPGKKNGFILCRDIKRNPETKDIKIILVSTKDQESDRFWGLKQGADAYFPKPFTNEELILEVRKYI